MMVFRSRPYSTQFFRQDAESQLSEFKTFPADAFSLNELSIPQFTEDRFNFLSIVNGGPLFTVLPSSWESSKAARKKCLATGKGYCDSHIDEAD